MFNLFDTLAAIQSVHAFDSFQYRSKRLRARGRQNLLKENKHLSL